MIENVKKYKWYLALSLILSILYFFVALDAVFLGEDSILLKIGNLFTVFADLGLIQMFFLLSFIPFVIFSATLYLGLKISLLTTLLLIRIRKTKMKTNVNYRFYHWFKRHFVMIPTMYLLQVILSSSIVSSGISNKKDATLVTLLLIVALIITWVLSFDFLLRLKKQTSEIS